MTKNYYFFAWLLFLDHYYAQGNTKLKIILVKSKKLTLTYFEYIECLRGDEKKAPATFRLNRPKTSDIFVFFKRIQEQ